MKVRVLAVAASFAVLAATGYAQSWTSYHSADWGYDAAVPPGFVFTPEMVWIGDILYISEVADAELIFTGGTVPEGDTFREPVSLWQDAQIENGWTVTREDGEDWARIRGTADSLAFNDFFAPRCGGTQLMGFYLLYDTTNAADAAAIEALIPQLEAGLLEGTCPAS